MQQIYSKVKIIGLPVNSADAGNSTSSQFTESLATALVMSKHVNGAEPKLQHGEAHSVFPEPRVDTIEQKQISDEHKSEVVADRVRYLDSKMLF